MGQNYGNRPDDGWAKIFRHNVSGGYWSSSNNWEEVKRSNIGDQNADKYSQLYKVNDSFKISGEYIFKLYFPSTGVTNIWAQTHDIFTNATTSTVPGYRAIDIDNSGNAWGGLSLSDGSNSYLDGNPTSTNWYYPIGQISAWNGGIPAYTSTGLPTMELYIRVRY